MMMMMDDADGRFSTPLVASMLGGTNTLFSVIVEVREA